MSLDNAVVEQIDQIGGTITKEGDFAVIRIPIKYVTYLRVALRPCHCVANKSEFGIQLRKRIAHALGRVLFN